jgi:hypothetical protein
MDAENRRMWEMIGGLSDAFWRRVQQPGVSAYEALLEKVYQPVSDEEKAIWSEITAPHNYASLQRYVESRNKSEMQDRAVTLVETLLAEATDRWHHESRSGAPDRFPDPSS